MMTPQIIPSSKPAIHKAPVRRPSANGRPRRVAEPKKESRQITPSGLLHAFRRKWIPAVAVAIPMALLAAVVVWELIPAHYKSFAIVKVNQYRQHEAYNTGDIDTNFLNYRDSQLEYIRNRVVLQAALRKPEVAQTETIKALQFPMEYLGGKLIVEPMESDEFIRIALKGNRPRELATIVNGVKDAYMNEVVFDERNEKLAKLERLKGVLAEREAKKMQAEKERRDLADGLGTVDVKIASMNIQLMNEELRDMLKTRRELRADLREEEGRRNRRLQQGLPPDLPTRVIDPSRPQGGGVQQDPTIANNILEMRRLKAYIARTERALAPGRPNAGLDRAKEQLEALQVEMGGGSGETDDGSRSVTYSRYESLKRQVEDIERDIQVTKAKIAEDGQKSIQLERAKDGVLQKKAEWLELHQRVSRLEVEMNAPTRVEEVHDAAIPDVRDTKTRTRLAAIAAVGMFAVVIAAFTLLEWMSQRIASPTELSKDTGLRLLGSLPAPEKPGMLGKLGFGEPNLNEWNRVLVESVDVVRTYLLRHMDTQQPQAIVVASASANEGKTTLSTQLGSSIARSGRRVCVVDCDFRRPSAHLVFQTEQGTGIGELLRAEADVESITRTTSIPGLFFISAGTIDDEALRVLALDGGETLVSTLKKHFDFVIIDTSPILFVAEPSMIAQHSDSVVLAVRRDYSRLGFVNEACQTLRNLQAPLAGAVMVGAESSIHRQTYGYQQDIRFAEPQQKHAKRGDA